MSVVVNGYRVKYELKDIPGKGKGIVAAEPIKAGQLIWSGENAAVQETLTKKQLKERVKSFANDEERRFFLNHIYCYGGVVCSLHDDSKYTNHSKKDPIMATADMCKSLGVSIIPFGRDPVDEWDCFARRDVAVGEEITDDYSHYENPDFYVKICKKYNVEWAGRVVELYSA